MAEFMAIAGVISSVITIIDTVKTVYDAVQDTSGLPEAFRVVRGQLPTVAIILEDAHAHTETGQVNQVTIDAIEPLIAQCKECAAKLEEIFKAVLPEADASTTRRGLKAIQALRKAGKVKELWKQMMEVVLVLATRHGMETATAHQVNELKESIEKMANVGSSLSDSESEKSSMTNNHFGPGPATYNQTKNKVEGNQKNLVNNKDGKAYQAETMHFGKDD